MLIGAQMLGFSVGGCILDALSGGVPAFGISAYRRLCSAHKRPCMNVRRSSDNSAIDIGYVGNELDQRTLLTFCGSGNGFVTTLYNNGTLGASGDISQSTAAAQPKIVSAGVVVTSAGNPSMLFDGVASGFLLPIAVIPSGSASSFMNIVLNYTATDAGNEVPISLGPNGGNTNRHMAILKSSYQTAIWNGSTAVFGSINLVPGSMSVMSALWTASEQDLWVDGALSLTGNMSLGTTNSSQAGTSLGLNGNVPLGGYVSEVVLDLKAWATSDRHTLERNQGSVYGATVS